ncbi:MAG TPA: adenylate/guanylate cyclase domain-containing protein, partial [Gemmatimonadales bacterium]|nr:adenylate/guanylate cyclase domain-containing protein [Gemmatimonadales bacterium]
PLKEAGAANGLANVSLDGDLVLRDLPQGADVFWREIVKLAAQRIPDIRAKEPPAGSRIRYVGADHTFPYVSYYQALEADTHLPPDAFRDQIVIVGFNVKATVDARAAQSDLFFTPFTAWTGGVTPGAEIHANILETAILGNAVATAAPHWTALLTLAVVGFTALLMRRWRPLLGAAFVLALVAAMAWASAYAFGTHHLWVPAAGAAAAAVAVYLSFGALAFLSERQRKAEMRRAFSLYVSPEVVEHVMAHPERLKLGGEHREITVMFTDLKGFTNLTEMLGAEQVAQVLNRHFSRATAIVKRNHGTVNRFIGDAVMAMWGAPVDDPLQADHAVRCALELQEDMELQRRELREQGLPEISMRIGIHTAVAIVGNLGSSDRFDYTAIGDGVNLAARLEPVNKLYGTGILLSGATVARLAEPVDLRPVDRVIVKGQTVPVDLFTPCADPIACELSRQA